MRLARPKTADYYIIIKEIGTGKTKTISYSTPPTFPFDGSMSQIDRMKYSVMAHLDLMEMDDIYLSATMMRVYEIIKEEGSFPELDQNKINNWIKKFKERKECYNKLLDEGIKAQEKKKK